MINMLVAIAVCGPFLGFLGGFILGQRSVRLLPTRTERLQVSERMTVERVLPEPQAKVVPVTHETVEDTGVYVPPQYRKMAEQYMSGGGK